MAAMAGAATMLIEANRYLNRATTLLSKAQMLAPNSPDVLAARFRLLMRRGREDEAVTTFRQLLDIDSAPPASPLISSSVPIVIVVGVAPKTRLHCSNARPVSTRSPQVGRQYIWLSAAY